jgi:hypothetical protein
VAPSGLNLYQISCKSVNWITSVNWCEIHTVYTQHGKIVGDSFLKVDSASNRNEYQEYFLGGKGGRCVGLTTLPPSCANCLEIWDPKSLSRPVMGLLYLLRYKNKNTANLVGPQCNSHRLYTVCSSSLRMLYTPTNIAISLVCVTPQKQLLS